MNRAMKSRNVLVAAVVIAAMLLPNILASAGRELTNCNQAALPQPKPKRISTSELKNLRWIEGTWRGSGDVQKPFFERYYFENDSTLAVETFTDETLTKVEDVTRFELKDGQLGNSGEGARWVATQLDKKSITFEPISHARNTFRWERQSKKLWKAVLNWPATAKAPAKQKVYQMERLPSPKH